MPSAPSPLRIACLHGYCQNSVTFRRKTGSLRKALQRPVSQVRASLTPPHETTSVLVDETLPLAQLIYLDAPFVLEELAISSDSSEVNHDLPPFSPKRFNPVLQPIPIVIQPATVKTAAPSASRPVQRRSWWASVEDDGRRYVGWSDSLAYLRDAFRKHRFDGIVGFSQGGIAASVISALRSNGECLDELSSLQFAMLFSCGESRSEKHRALYKNGIDIASLHVWGNHDEVVSWDLSEDLSRRFREEGRQVFIHDGGHMVPGDGMARKNISQFVLSMWEKIYGGRERNDDDNDDDNDNDDAKMRQMQDGDIGNDTNNNCNIRINRSASL